MIKYNVICPKCSYQFQQSHLITNTENGKMLFPSLKTVESLNCECPNCNITFNYSLIYQFGIVLINEEQYDEKRNKISC